MDIFERILKASELYDDNNLKNLIDSGQVTTASNINRPEPKQSVKEIDLFNAFMKRNPKSDGGMLVKPSADGSRPGYAKVKKGPGGQPKKYNLEAIEEAILKANQGDKFVSYEEIGKKFGFKSEGRISGIVRREGITPLDSYKVKAEKAFIKLFSDPNKNAMELTKPLHRIKEMIGGYKVRKNANPNRSRVDDISNALKNSKVLNWDEEVKPIINKLSSANFIKEIDKNWTLGDVENTIQSKSMLRAPKTDAERLMDYVVRNQRMSKGSSEFSIYNKNNLNKRITDFSKIDSYHDIAFKDGSGKVYDLDYIKTKGRNDPLFKEYFELQDQLLEMRNRTTWPDGSDIIDPKTGKKTNFGSYSGQMYKFGYGYKNPFSRFPYEIDHKEGVGKNPFKNLAILPQRVNVGLGAASRLDKPEIASKMGKDFFRNLSTDDLLMQEKNLGEKILVFNKKGEHVGKTLKPSFTAAKDEILRKNILSKFAAIGCQGKAKGGRVDFNIGGSTECITRGLEKVKTGTNLSPGDQANIRRLNDIAKTAKGARAMGSAARIVSGLGLGTEAALGGFFALTDYATGADKQEIFSNLTYGLAGKDMQEQLKQQDPMYGKADKLDKIFSGYLTGIDRPKGLRPGKITTETDVSKAMQPFTRVNPQTVTGDFFDFDKFQTQMQKDREAEETFAKEKIERALERGFYDPGIGGSQRISEFAAANGGIAGLSGGAKSGPPPESGKKPHGLLSIKNNVKKY